MVRERAVWDILSDIGKQVILLGVPLTYPPKPLNGCMVADFLTPTVESDYTYPSSLKDEIGRVVGDYMVDVKNFRTDDKVNLLAQIYEMTEKRFTLARHLMTRRPWDLFMMVEIGSDRLHHGFWRYHDETHPKHKPDSPYQHAIRDYYIYLDKWIGTLLAEVGKDTLVIVVSDHGAQRMDGGVCFNEWLIREGYLRLLSDPVGVTKIEEASIDWERTTAWGDGGYYGRLFLNVRGREPQGVIHLADYERVRNEIAEKLRALTDETGRNIGTKVFTPEQVYADCRNIPPDLIVHFGDLFWRSVGSIGYGSIWTRENDTGPDDANHAQYGMFIMSDLRERRGWQRDGLRLVDVAPTVLEALGLPAPPDMQGTTIGWEEPAVYTEEEEEVIRQRLADLGYL
jgi:predicted AlkP superfamily phosphohydrolase/phosphomutase